MTEEEAPRRGLTIPMDGRTIGLSVVFLLGGGGTAIGTNLVGEGPIRAEMAELKAEISDVQRSVDTVAVNVLDLKADLRIERNDLDAVREDVEELKTEVKDLRRKLSGE